MMRSLYAPRARGVAQLLRVCCALGVLSFSACEDAGTEEMTSPTFGTPGGAAAGTGGAGGATGAGSVGGATSSGPIGGATTSGPTGGATTSGPATGSTGMGGSLSGGGQTGGRTGGAMTGGATTGGAMTGGATTGGAMTGGATTGGAMTGGAMTGGGTAGATTGGATTGGGMTGGGMTGGAARKPPCLKKPSQVVAIGDSYVSLPVVLVPKIEALAVTGGALMSGQHYRDYSAPGTTLGSPTSPGSIPPQWDAAKRADPDIKTLIMDGGGNDILGDILGPCLSAGAAQMSYCTDLIKGCMGVVRKLAMDAKATGVRDLVYFLYPHVPIGGDDILDYSVQEARKLAAEVSTDAFRMHLIDTIPAFMGHAEYFGLDPIHANDAGGQVIAKLIWDTMKSKCIAQPASSGCCEP